MRKPRAPERGRALRIGALIAAAALAPGARAVALGAQAVDRDFIVMHAAAFDPLREVPDLARRVPDGSPLREASGPDAYLVQFDRPVIAGVREAIEARGALVLGYVPHRTLMVRIDPSKLSDLGSIPGVRWIGRLLPAYKLSPDLVGVWDAAECSSQPVALDVLLFRGEDPGPLVAAIRLRFPEVRVEGASRRVPARIALDVPRAVIAPLAGALLRDPAVEFIAPRPEFAPQNDDAVWIGQSYDRWNGPPEAEASDPKDYALSGTIWAHGLIGTGQVVAVADTGLEHGMCFFDDPGRPVTPQTVTPPAPLALDLDHRKILAYNAPLPSALATDDAFRHGTHTSGSAVADDLAHLATRTDAGHDHGDGMAPGAKLVFEDVSGAVTSSCSTKIVVGSMGDLFEQEYAAGARISTNSFGAAAGLAFDSQALEADVAAWTHEDFAVFIAAGNRGALGVMGFALCKNCVAVGAAENYDIDFVDALGHLDPENMAALSSHGPTPDGRIKPDITAPGFRVDSVRLPIEYIPDEGDPACNPSNPGVCLLSIGGCYHTDTSATCSTGLLFGTSMASPIAAGLAALTRQYFIEGFYPTGQASPADARNPSAALLKATLINGARNMTGHVYERRGTPVDLGPLADAPSAVQGWGRVMLDDALYFAGDTRRAYLLDRPNAEGLVTGQSISLALLVSSTAEPLKLTLVWTDAPGEPLASGALVNDLDLVLEAPDGTLYRGNQWSDNPAVHGDKQSLPDSPGNDDVNNVEGILLAAPRPGLYHVTIEASDVPVGPQGAALVVTGAVVAPGPAPVPDGLFGSSMKARRMNPAGTTIRVQWDVATCPAPGHHLLYGSLAGVAVPGVGGAVCGLNPTGTHVWAGVPAGNLWFLVVSDDGDATEGTWGSRSDGSPIGGGAPSGLCGLIARDNSGVCEP